MKSYLAIDRVEGKYAVCELELVDIDTSKILSAKDKPTKMVDYLAENIANCVGSCNEGDILVVDQENGIILVIYGKDDDEKKRRLES